MTKALVSTALILLIAGVVAVLALFPSKAPAQGPMVTMYFTVPQGTLAGATYAMRFSRNPVGADTTSWWAAAALVPNLPAPGAVGSTDSVQVAVSLWGQSYYFVERTCNGQMCSGYSNVAVVTTPVAPPARVTDLRGR